MRSDALRHCPHPAFVADRTASPDAERISQEREAAFNLSDLDDIVSPRQASACLIFVGGLRRVRTPVEEGV